MPAAYAAAFDPSEVAEHARIVERRGASLVHAELCRNRSGARVCLVAEERPGLLALVTDALLVHGLGIQSALVFCRKPRDGKAEAVDFFQLRQSSASGEEADIGAPELAAFVQTLSEMVAEDALAAARFSGPRALPQATTRVYFELEALRRDEFALIVEARDTHGLLHAITSALHVQGVRVLASEIRTEAGVAYDRFELVAYDGEPLSAVRLCDVQLAVYSALPTAARRSRP